MRTGLLISVRDAGEAGAACGDADLIDIKEPSRGSLGRADDATIDAIITAVGNQLPISAALGELRDVQPLPSGWEKLAFVKWGLSGCAGTKWTDTLRQKAEQLGSRVVIVAYADATMSQSPEVGEILAFALSRPWSDAVMLIDTFDKSPDIDGRKRHLLEWLPLIELQAVVSACHDRGVRIALAGSLGFDEIRQIVRLHPDWIGVRGAVCERADRGAGLSPERIAAVRQLLIHGS